MIQVFGLSTLQSLLNLAGRLVLGSAAQGFLFSFLNLPKGLGLKPHRGMPVDDQPRRKAPGRNEL